MTATAASPPVPGRSLPQLPAPPMPAGQPRGGGRSCLGGLTSCFWGSPVADSDAGLPVDHRGRRSSWFSWSKKKKRKKKTVPVDATAGEPAPPAGRVVKAAAGKGADVQNEEEKKDQGEKHSQRTAASPAKSTKPAAAMESLVQRLFQKLRKGSKDKTGPTTPITGSHTDEVSKSDRRRPPPPSRWQIRLASLSPKYDSRGGLPARTPPETARTALRRTGRTSAAPAAGGARASSSSDAAAPQYSTTSSPHGGAPAPSRLGFLRSQKNTPELEPPRPPRAPGSNGQLLGLSVMAVVLVMVVLFGRVSAVVFTCVWLYCLPRVRATMAEPRGGGSKSVGAGAGVNMDSGEYKKRVVLEGLLQRDGRRSPGLQ